MTDRADLPRCWQDLEDANARHRVHEAQEEPERKQGILAGTYVEPEITGFAPEIAEPELVTVADGATGDELVEMMHGHMRAAEPEFEARLDRQARNTRVIVRPKRRVVVRRASCGVRRARSRRGRVSRGHARRTTTSRDDGDPGPGDDGDVDGGASRGGTQ